MSGAAPCMARAPAPSDGELMRRLASGEISALGELYDRYQQPIRRYLARATADADDVDDLVHGTFLAAARSADRFAGSGSCRPWLIGIATHLLRRRRRAFSRLIDVLSSLGPVRRDSFDPRARLQAKGDVERALARISEVKRVTLLMAEVEEMSCAEIAAILEVPVGTVWTRLHAARRELRLLLEGER